MAYNWGAQINASASAKKVKQPKEESLYDQQRAALAAQDDMSSWTRVGQGVFGTGGETAESLMTSILGAGDRDATYERVKGYTPSNPGVAAAVQNFVAGVDAEREEAAQMQAAMSGYGGGYSGGQTGTAKKSPSVYYTPSSVPVSVTEEFDRRIRELQNAIQAAGEAGDYNPVDLNNQLKQAKADRQAAIDAYAASNAERAMYGQNEVEALQETLLESSKRASRTRQEPLRTFNPDKYEPYQAETGDAVQAQIDTYANNPYSGMSTEELSETIEYLRSRISLAQYMQTRALADTSRQMTPDERYASAQEWRDAEEKANNDLQSALSLWQMTEEERQQMRGLAEAKSTMVEAQAAVNRAGEVYNQAIDEYNASKSEYHEAGREYSVANAEARYYADMYKTRANQLNALVSQYNAYLKNGADEETLRELYDAVQRAIADVNILGNAVETKSGEAAEAAQSYQQAANELIGVSGNLSGASAAMDYVQGRLENSIGAYYDVVSNAFSLPEEYKNAYENVLGLTVLIDGYHDKLDALYEEENALMAQGQYDSPRMQEVDALISEYNQKVTDRMLERAQYYSYAYTYDYSRTLESLSKQEYERFENVIRNGNKTDRDALIEEYGEKQYSRILEMVRRSVNEQKRAAQQEKIKDLEGWGAIGANALSVATNIIGVPGVLYEVVRQGLSNYGSIGDYNAYHPFDTNAGGFFLQNYTKDVRGITAQKVETNALAAGKSELAAHFDSMAYSTLMSGIDSAVAVAIGQVGMVAGVSSNVGGNLLGATAASNAMQDILDRGGSLAEILVGGTVAGVFETLFENWSIENFTKLAQTEVVTDIYDVIKNIGKSMLTNASEEFNTELANVSYDLLVGVLGMPSEWKARFDELKASEKLTDSQAFKVVAAEIGAQVGESALSGALMGAAFGLVGSTKAYHNYSRVQTVMQSAVDDEIKKRYASLYDMNRLLSPEHQVELPEYNEHLTLEQLNEVAQQVMDEVVKQNLRDKEQSAKAESSDTEANAEVQAKAQELSAVNVKTNASITDVNAQIEAGAEAGAADAQTQAQTAQAQEGARIDENAVSRETSADTAQAETAQPAEAQAQGETDEQAYGRYTREQAQAEIDAIDRGGVEQGAYAQRVEDRIAEVRREGREDVADAMEQIVAERSGEAAQTEQTVSPALADISARYQQAVSNLTQADAAMVKANVDSIMSDARAAQDARQMAQDAANPFVAMGQNDVANAIIYGVENAIAGGNDNAVYSDEGGERNARAYTAGEGRRVESGAGETGSAGEAAESEGGRYSAAQSGTGNAGESERVNGKPVQMTELSSKYGKADTTVNVINDTTTDPRHKVLLDKADADGVKLRLVDGPLTFTVDGKDFIADGFIDDDGTITINVNSADFTPEQLYDHEHFHSLVAKNSGLFDEVRKIIEDRYDEVSGRLRDVLRLYKAAYAGSGSSYLYLAEELCADCYAGMNRFAYGQTALVDEVRAAVDGYGGEAIVDIEHGEGYSVGYTTNGERFVDVQNDILSGVDPKDWNDTVKTALKTIFPNGIKANGQYIKVNKQTRKEVTGSKYTEYLRAFDQSALLDKFRAMANADELIEYAENWSNEDLNHPRNDNITKFATADVLMRIGTQGYDALVVVATTTDGSAVLYDLIDLVPTNIDEKQTPYAAAPKGVEQQKQGPAFDLTLSRSDDSVKRFSAVSSSADREYMNAVESGDMETAQRMVDEAAKAAMPDTKIVDEDGNPLLVYHGTDENFTVFDRTKGRSTMDIQGSFFSPWELDASGYGRNVGKYYLNITNPASEAEGYRALRRFQGQNNAGVKAREYLESLGYDGVNNGNEEFIAFNPEQVKSADPVTYDDDGNVIPLSERFNEKKRDIRFSAAESHDELTNTVEAGYQTSEDGKAPTMEMKFSASSADQTLKERERAMYAEALEKRNSQLADLLHKQWAAEDKAKELYREANMERAAYQADGNVDHLARAAELQKQGKNEHAKANRLSKQTNLPVGKWYEPKRAVRTAVDTIMKSFSVKPGMRAQYRAKLSDLLNDIYRKGKVEDADIFRIASNLADDSINYVATDPAYDAVYNEYLKNAHIYVDEATRAEFGDGWDDFRRYCWSLGIYLTSNAEDRGVDSYYSELSESVSRSIFDEDVTDKASQLQIMADAAKLGQPRTASLVELAQDEGVTSDEFYETLFEEVLNAVYTFADQANLESQVSIAPNTDLMQQRAHYEAKIERAGERNRAARDAQEQRTRERIADIRESEQQKRDDLRQRLTQEGRDMRDEAVARERQKRDEMLAKFKQHVKDVNQRAKERRQRSETMQMIRRELDRIYKRAKVNEENYVRMISQQDDGVRERMEDAYSKLNGIATSMVGYDITNPAQLAGWLDDYRRANTNFDSSHLLDDAVNALAKIKDWQKMNVEDLELLSDVLTAIDYALNTANKMVGEDWDSRLDETAEKMRDETKKAKGSRLAGKDAKDMRVRIGNLFNEESLSYSRNLKRYGNWDPNSVMYKFAEAFERGDMKYMNYKLGADMVLRPFLDRWKNADRRGWAYTAAGEDAKLTELTFPASQAAGRRDADPSETVKVNVNQMQLVQMYLDLRNEDNLRHVKYGGYTFPNAEMYNKNGRKAQAYTDENGITVKLTKEQIQNIVDKHLASEGKEFAELLDKYYNVYAKPYINATSRALEGRDKAVNDHYYPIRIDKNYKADSYNFYNGVLENMGPLKERIAGANNPIYLCDADETYEWHKELMAKYVGYAIPLRDFQTVLNYAPHHDNTTNRAVLTGKYSENAGRFLDDFFKVLESNKLEDAKGLRTILGNYISNILNANISSMLKQFAALPLAGSTYGMEPIMYAVSHLHKGVDLDLVRKYTAYLDERADGITYDRITDIARKKAGSKSKLLSDTLLGRNWLSGTDYAANKMMWIAAEHYVDTHTSLQPGTEADIQAGKDPYYQKVAEVFNRMTFDTQTNANTMAKPNILRRVDSGIKAFTLFKTDAFQMQGILREAYGQLQWAMQNGTDAEKRDAKQKVYHATQGVIVSSVVQAAFAALAKILRRRDDELRDKEGNLDLGKSAMSVGYDVLENMVGAMLFGSEAFSLIASVANKTWGLDLNESWYDIDASAIDAINDIANVIRQQLPKMFNALMTASAAKDPGQYLLNNSDNLSGPLFKLAKQIGAFFGVPVANIEKNLMGILGWINPSAAVGLSDLYNTYTKSSLAGLQGDELDAAIRAYLTDEVGQLSDEAIKEYVRLYSDFGNKVLPGFGEPTVYDDDGEKRDMTAYELAAWDSAYRETLIDIVNGIVASDAYKAMTDDEKRNVLGRAETYTKDAAKAVLGIETSSKIQDGIDAGTDPAYAVLCYDAMSSQSKYADKFLALDALDIPDEQKAAYFHANYPSTAGKWHEAAETMDDLEFLEFARDQYGAAEQEETAPVQTQQTPVPAPQTQTAVEAVPEAQEQTEPAVDPEKEAKYQAAAEAGMSDSGARAAVDAVTGIDSDKARDRQTAAVHVLDSVDDQLAAVRYYADKPEADYARFSRANDYGVTPDEFFTFFDDLVAAYTLSQENAEKMLDTLDLTQEQKAAMWQLCHAGWSAKKNPYAVYIGEQIKEAYDTNK